MADPIDELHDYLAALADMPEGLNIYPAPEEKLVVPALVIRPDPLWLRPDRMCFDLEGYNVIAAVTANSPADGIGVLRSMMLKIIAALPSPWAWTQVDGPVVDQSTGIPFLAARLRLEYKNGGPE